MPVRNASAVWEGDLPGGKGTMRFGSWEGPYSFSSRFEEGEGANPEELIAAAHAGCFSMALSNAIAKAGFTPKRVQTRAAVNMGKVDGRSRITRIDLETEAEVLGMDSATFYKLAEETKIGCPVSAALAAVEITLNARLV